MSKSEPQAKYRKTPKPLPPVERERGRSPKAEIAAPVVVPTLGKSTRQETATHRASILKKGKVQRATRDE